MAAILKGITAAASMEALKANYDAAILMLDQKHHDAVKKAKNTRYRELEKAKEAA